MSDLLNGQSLLHSPKANCEWIGFFGVPLWLVRSVKSGIEIKSRSTTPRPKERIVLVKNWSYLPIDEEGELDEMASKRVRSNAVTPLAKLPRTEKTIDFGKIRNLEELTQTQTTISPASKNASHRCFN